MVQAQAQPPPGSPSSTDTGEQLPRAFGKYTLLRKLATGGMAELFLALHRSVAGFEKLVVIKRILPAMNQDAAFIEMLLHEARIAATLSHPNIVQTFDVGQIEDTYFIAMEHINGEDIRSIVRAMKKNAVTEFPLEHTIGIILGMCSGLAYAHDRRDLDGQPLNIVHRDISPQNIVVTFSGDVKIVDFGIAKSQSQLKKEDTKSGQLKGKVPYMSPEQAAGQPIDWRSDIFATGVMLFELTTGKRLFKAQSEYETLKLICERDYPRPSQVRPGYPAQLEQIVMRALAKKREDRYQGAQEMQADLESFVREERLPVSTVGMSQWMQSLFADKIAAQKEALSDVKQLADIIAKQEGERPSLQPYDGSGSGTHTGVKSAPGASSTIPAPAPKRSSAGIWVGALGVAALGVGGFLYLSAGDRNATPTATPVPPPTDTSETPVAEKIRGSLSITSTPDGCAIWIDGDLREQTTPATVDNLPLGKAITIKLTKEGLVSNRQEITLTEAEPNQNLEVEMTSGSVTVLIDVKPEPAVWVDGKEWDGDRSKLEGLSPNEKHKITLVADGHEPMTVFIQAKAGETKTIAEKLRPKVDGGAAGPAVPSGPPGTVRVGATGGFCNVSINGSAYGPTPVQAQVPPGPATVRCTTADGKALVQGVVVKSGETARAVFSIP